MSEFVLTGGHVVDPSQGIDRPMEVVVRDGHIGALVHPAAPIPSDAWREDVSGAIVTPGLVDLHGHWYEGSAWGIDPLINLRSGVTTPCDAGSSGYVTFPLFRKLIDAGPVRVLVFLHIGSLGAVSMNAGELEDFRYVRVSDTVETINRKRDLILGIKARLGPDTR